MSSILPNKAAPKTHKGKVKKKHKDVFIIPNVTVSPWSK